MIFFVLRRSFFAIVLLLIVSAFTFVIFSALPSDPAALTCGKNCRPEVIESNRERLGYDRPLVEQYGAYMKGIFAGRTYGEEGSSIHCSAPSLGYSYDRHECVTTLIASTLPVTASIALGAFVLWMAIGVGLGTLAALKRGKMAGSGGHSFQRDRCEPPDVLPWFDLHHGLRDLDGLTPVPALHRSHREPRRMVHVALVAVVRAGDHLGGDVRAHDP